MLTRREILLGGAVLGAGLVACSTSTSSSSSVAGSPAGSATASPTETGPWTFVDDRGVEISLPSAPQRIVAEADAAAALWDYGVHPVGIFASSPLGDAAQLANVDLSQVEAVGEGYGQIKLEKLAALQPDLIVGVWYSPDDYLYGFNNKRQEQEIAAIAPTLGINAHVVADVAVARFAELAEALGVDLDDPTLTEARQRYEDASQAVRDVTAAKPDLKVLAVYPGSSELYVLVPEDSADLALLQELGANMVDPDTDDPYYEIISWENADRYPADVIVMDERAVGVEETSWEQQPVWQQLPAVEADQVGLWITPAPFSWQAYAAVLEEFTALLSGATAVA